MENSHKNATHEILKQGLMVKRSQNKKRFTPVNYKQRWFVLTNHSLIYYEPNSDVSLYIQFIYIEFIVFEC